MNIKKFPIIILGLSMLFAAQSCAEKEEIKIPVKPEVEEPDFEKPKPEEPDEPELPTWNAEDWELVESLSDEFDGDELDASKWLNYHPYWSGRTPSQFNRDNVSVGDGCAMISASVADAEKEGSETENWIWTGCIASKARTATYAYYEAKMKTTNLSISNAFWLQGEGIEIDVTEAIGNSKKSPTASYEMKINTHDFREGWDKDITSPFDTKLPEGKKCSDDFFVYGVLWEEDNITFYLNRKKVWEVKKNFDLPQYLFLDMEAFIWQGLPTVEELEDKTKNVMYIDYVRTYKYVGSKE